MFRVRNFKMKLRLKSSCCSVQTGNISTNIHAEHTPFLVQSMPNFQAHLTGHETSYQLYEITLTFKLLHTSEMDENQIRMKKLDSYCSYLRKRKITYCFIPEYHSSGQSAGLLHYHGYMAGSDYEIMMKAFRYYRRNGIICTQQASLQGDYKIKRKITNFNNWLGYITKDKEIMRYDLYPIYISHKYNPL